MHTKMHQQQQNVDSAGAEQNFVWIATLTVGAAPAVAALLRCVDVGGNDDWGWK